jgi:hypothetical protein
MTIKEQEEYLKRWSNGCFLCSKKMTEKHLIESIVPLAKCPDHADPEYTHYYCVCTECFEKGILL